MPLKGEAKVEYNKQYRAANKDKIRKLQREWEKKHRAVRAEDRGGKLMELRKFVGVDGEGGNDADGNHWYMSLRVGNDLLYHPDGSPLSGIECFYWLADIANKYRKTIPVAFAFDYDVSMMLRDFPKETLDQLFTVDEEKNTNTQTAFYGHGKDTLMIQYIPKKYLRVGYAKKERPGSVSITISDTFGFFQTSFLKAIKSWGVGTKGQHAVIEENKKNRTNFIATFDKTVLDYNEMECELLAQLMDKVRKAVHDAGYTMTRWQGAGSLAQAILKKHNAPKKKPYSDDPRIHTAVYEAAMAAYYGGRFENMAMGEVPDPYSYDISSAYPYAMTQLPCLEHGRWNVSRRKCSWKRLQEMSPYTLCHVKWGIETGSYDPKQCKSKWSTGWGGLPFRTPAGYLLYPSQGGGWYWKFEVEAARKLTWPKFVIEVKETIEFVPECNEHPFDFNNELFALRLKWGKSDAGKALKLGMNSEYGKMVQSVGSAPYGNPVYGSMITAMTRTQILKMIAANPYNIVAIATDGIMTSGPLTIPDDQMISSDDKKVLGGWECEKLDYLWLIQPGVYVYSSNGEKSVKSRGIFSQDLKDAFDKIKYEYWYATEGPRRKAKTEIINGRAVGTDEGEPLWYQRSVTLPSRTMFQGVRLAYSQGNLDKAGQWPIVERKIDFGANLNKREIAGGWPTGSLAVRTKVLDRFGIRNSWNDIHGEDGGFMGAAYRYFDESTPYKKRIGGNIVAEYSDFLFEHPDGPEPTWDDWEVI